MRYAVENERTVYLQGAPETGFSLYGEIPDGGEASFVNLGEVLLEFAMSWDVPGAPTEARRQMQIFGTHIGEALWMHPLPTASPRARCITNLIDAHCTPPPKLQACVEKQSWRIIH
jgi:hypothetical protein